MHKKLWWYLGFFVVSVFVIFFVGKTVYDDGTSHVSIKTSLFCFSGGKLSICPNSALRDFRLGMDIAGGVSLTYKLDFSEYEKTYTNQEDLQIFKRKAIEIARKQIDSRISSLGVSDYEAKHRRFNNNDYIVVDIGGVHNLNFAKDIIGKTVTLSFKVPVEKPDKMLIEARRKQAQEIYARVKKQPDLLPYIVSEVTMTDMFYYIQSGKATHELSKVYADYLTKNVVASGALLPFLEGIHHYEYTDQQGNMRGVTGYVIARVLSKRQTSLTHFSPEKVLYVLEQNGYKPHLSTTFTDPKIQSGTVVYEKGTLVYNAGLLFPGQSAYEATIYQLEKPSLVGKKQEDVATALANWRSDIAKVKSALQENKKPQVAGAVLLVEKKWIPRVAFDGIVKNFTFMTGVQVVETGDVAFVVSITATKGQFQQMRQLISASNVTPAQYAAIEKQLKTENIYTIEEIFIRDMPQWTPAKDPITNEILDAKFFKSALVGQGQLGEPVVQINFDEKGKQIFCNISEKYIKKQLAIFIGDNPEPVTAPVIQEKICGGAAIIHGNFTRETARATADELNKGAFPVNMTLESQENVSPRLGSFALTGALVAGGVAFVLIFVFLLVLYNRKKAVIGLLVLTVFVTYLLATLKLIDYAFSLAGIAAIILGIGMAIDANILIFERLKEEISSGKTITSAIEAAMKRSRFPIRDGNISTGIIALILFFIGMSVFKGFGAMTLIIMVFVLVVNVPLTRYLLEFFYAKKNK